MRAIIWCEVSCNNCNAVIGFNYRNAKTISALKKAVRNWRYCGEYGNLCPECYKKWKGRKRISKFIEQVIETSYSGDNISGHD